jgi:uncharacterized protein YcbX
MSDSSQTILGSVAALWRYPVKSMMGEELNAVELTLRGLLGDRAYGLVDSADGKIATAKNPRKWPHLFDFRAALTEAPRNGGSGTVRITLPDGTIVSSEQRDIDYVLSQALKRDVTLRAAERRSEQQATAEEYWPDMEGLDHRDTVTDFALPEGTFFDAAFVHVLTTATLERLRESYPEGRFEIRRFRPNIVVETASGAADFAENAWVGQTLAIGEGIRLSITGATGRCVMTTLPQGDLPNDTRILRTAAQQNDAKVGVYASVTRGGTVRRGDVIMLE